MCKKTWVLVDDNESNLQEALALLSDCRNIFLNEKLEQRYKSHINKIVKLLFVFEGMTKSKIEEKINDFILKTGSKPSFMVIHPKTFSSLIKGLTGVDPLDSTGFMQYNNIRVYRSLDIDEGEIEI